MELLMAAPLIGGDVAGMMGIAGPAMESGAFMTGAGAGLGGLLGGLSGLSPFLNIVKMIMGGPSPTSQGISAPGFSKPPQAAGAEKPVTATGTEPGDDEQKKHRDEIEGFVKQLSGGGA